MTVSLLGIIFVQLFWMNKAFTIKESQFDQQVNEALLRASYRIERNQNANFMTRFLSGMPQGRMIQKMNPSGINPANDSVFAEFKDFLKGKKEPIRSDHGSHHVKMQKTDENGIETIRYSFDTLIADGNSTQFIQSYSQFSSPKSTNSAKKNTETATQNNNQPNNMEEQLNEVMEQMILEFSIRDIPIEERLSYSKIAPTLDFELKNLNIPLKFEYAITDFHGNYYDKLITKGFNKEKSDKAYKTTLFPSDILLQSDKLVLYFPEKRNYLLTNLIWPFTGSIIFTIIILFTFYYTLKTIFNQKKISEIKTDFINNMTHEFKTPIATISLAADSITNPTILNYPEKVSRFIGIIKDENRRMNRQVESVLKMALVDKKDFNLNVKDTPVHPLIEQAVKNISLQVEQKGGNIEWIAGAENDLLWVDETHFANLVYNLLDNANKYSLNAPPDIKVSTYNSNGNFYLAIADKGIGMDKDALDKIFEKFYRVPTGNVHTVKGFGLGLSYVKAIAMQFKGDVSVVSEKGIGSTFTLKFPNNLQH
jgi:two-component system phosphate regulon sensor histidine kinase PhoR